MRTWRSRRRTQAFTRSDRPRAGGVTAGRSDRRPSSPVAPPSPLTPGRPSRPIAPHAPSPLTPRRRSRPIARHTPSPARVVPGTRRPPRPLVRHAPSRQIACRAEQQAAQCGTGGRHGYSGCGQPNGRAARHLQPARDNWVTPETDFNPFDPDQCRFDYGTITPSPSIPTPWGSPEDVGLGVDARHAAKAGNNLKRHGESQ
jgi:hypothetical protein